MGYTTSTVHGIEVPDSAEANNVPEDIGKVVTALEAGSLVRRLTGAQIAALTSPQKPAGLLVYNTTTNKLQISDGTNFANVDAAALLRAGGTMSGAIAMGSNKITGLAKGTASGDAMARQQVQSGEVSPFTGPAYTTVSFSPAFASAPVVVACPTDAVTEGFWVANVTASSARIYNARTAGPAGFTWIAVGN